MNSGLDKRLIAEISKSTGIEASEVSRAVNSFFGSIVRNARRLPFNNPSRIYSREKFNEFVKVANIPSIGRMGPVYSRYLKWRANESKTLIQEARSKYRRGITKDEIEHMAEEIISGRTPPPLIRKRGNEMYNRVWLVGQDGKKLARQVIPKTEE